jgi:hypothetical protein
MLTAFKILTMLWPFIKEMLFGQKTVRQILQEHRGTVAVMVVIAALLAANLFITNRLVVISHDYLLLQKKYKTLEENQPKTLVVQVPVPTPAPIAVVTPTRPATENKPKKTKKPSVSEQSKKDASERYRRLQKSLTALKNDESEPVPEN